MPSTSSCNLNQFRDFQRGDPDAWQLIFERHRAVLQARVSRKLPKRLLRRISISDILQETHFVAFQRRQDFQPDGPGAMRRWLFGILENKIRETIRFHNGTAKRDVGREVPRGLRVDTAQFRAIPDSPSLHAIAHETALRAGVALRTLSADHREVLRLAREEELPLREVARRMGRSREAIKKLYGRALCRFKQTFDRLGGADE